MSEFGLDINKTESYDLFEHLNDKNFNPTPFIKQQFSLNNTFGEMASSEGLDLIQEIKGKILDAEESIKTAEEQIFMDKKNF
jgi:hypothetical protein